ncbi:MAG: peptidylprolyl isomerase [Fimbriimonas sp.]
MKRLLLGLSLLILVLAIGCGGSSSGGSTSGLSLTPATSTVRVGSDLQFLAFFQGSPAAVTWSVTGGSANGAITSGGLYKAPSTAGNYEVVVALASNPSISATARVTVNPPVAISIDGAGSLPRMIPRSEFNFNATVANATNSAVKWSVTGGTTVIETNGLFTAPNTPGIYTIVARSVEDPSKTAETTIEVVADLDVTMEIEGKGTVKFDLRPDKAPNTCANFVTLVNSKFYDGILFHRYETDSLQIIQGGDPLTKTLPLSDPKIGTGGPGYKIPFEANSLLHEKYALAMARESKPDTAGSQFYICQEPQSFLDGNYVVFGKAIGGTDVVDGLRRGDKITSARTTLP